MSNIKGFSSSLIDIEEVRSVTNDAQQKLKGDLEARLNQSVIFQEICNHIFKEARSGNNEVHLQYNYELSDEVMETLEYLKTQGFSYVSYQVNISDINLRVSW